MDRRHLDVDLSTWIVKRNGFARSMSELAAEMAALAGGADALTARATELAAAGDLRLACQVVELAVQADPESTTAHGARAEIYQQRRNKEFSLMSKGIFAATARESRAIADQ